MRILFLCKRYYTNKDLMEDKFGRFYHLPAQLARNGASVTVVAMDYRGVRTKKIISPSVIFRTIRTNPVKPLNLFVDLYRFRNQQKPDILLASGDSHIGFIGLLISRYLGIKFVYDVYDYYPAFKGNRIPGMKSMFRTAVMAADLVTCASNPLKRKLSELNPKCLWIGNGVERDIFKPMDMVRARTAHKLKPDSTIVGFFGSLSPLQGPLLIEACRILRKKIPNLNLLLSGSVSNMKLEEPWILHKGVVPQKFVPCLIAACNVVAVPLANHPQNNLSGACKVAEYLACGKPVVATRISEHGKFFKSAPAALCNPDPEDMATAIQRQLKMQQVAAFPENLDWRNIGDLLYKNFCLLM